MDHHDSPFAVKANLSNPKTKPMLNQAPKMMKVQPQFCRQKRAFGTARSTNITTKPLTEKYIITPKIAIPQKQSKSTPTLEPSVVDATTKLGREATEIEFPENVNPILNKKNDSFQQGRAGKASKNSKEKDSTEPQTPVASHFKTTKSMVSATPFYSALHCTKCRFDRLATSSYWTAQIKLAESVGKHFVAVDFFRLAIESQAQPLRNLRIELKRYLSRHGYLCEQKEWREVGVRYGLLKIEKQHS